MELQSDKMQVAIAPAHQEKIPASEQAALKVAALNATAEKNATLSATNSPADKVTISEEAREKSVNDANQAAMRKMMGKEEVDGTDGEKPQTLDEKIAELQEKIAKLTAEIAHERRSGNDEKVKGMEAELAMLNSQLLQLIEQKMEESKASA
ncbi:MAG: PDZ domain-containing secreted protein [Alteromonadaceae bacterium]|jgi:PDZ domain-containing secreted protein